MDDTSKILMIVLFVVWFILVIPCCFYCKKKGYCPERAGGGYLVVPGWYLVVLMEVGR